VVEKGARNILNASMGGAATVGKNIQWGGILVPGPTRGKELLIKFKPLALQKKSQVKRTTSVRGLKGNKRGGTGRVAEKS